MIPDEQEEEYCDFAFDELHRILDERGTEWLPVIPLTVSETEEFYPEFLKGS